MTKCGRKNGEHEPFYSFGVSYVLLRGPTEHTPGLHLSYLTVNTGIFPVI